MSSWKNSVTDIISRFSGSAEQMPFLLEVLTVVPEEVTLKTLKTSLLSKRIFVFQIASR
jgi:hypothetical protein